MNRKTKRAVAIDTKDYRVKDRGDLKKVGDRTNKKIDEEIPVKKCLKVTHPERGDSERKPSNQKPEKLRTKTIDVKATNDEFKVKKIIDKITEKDSKQKKNVDKDIQDKTQGLELRKRIRDRYTLKLKRSVNKNEHNNSVLNKKDGGKLAAGNDSNKIVDIPENQMTETTTQTNEKQNQSSNTSTKTDKTVKANRVLKTDKHNTRKPIIKTIMSKSCPVRIYKAVTFVDEKHSQDEKPTPLQISIPCEPTKKKNVSKFTDTSSLKFKSKSNVSIKEKPVRKKTERRRERRTKRTLSPDVSIVGSKSPLTEVARWAPTSMNAQTKPYYEAWVDTTLAAVSKNSTKDKQFYEKQKNILLSFQKALLERPKSPELFYENCADERYTGRIKITQR